MFPCFVSSFEVVFPSKRASYALCVTLASWQMRNDSHCVLWLLNSTYEVKTKIKQQFRIKSFRNSFIKFFVIFWNLMKTQTVMQNTIIWMWFLLNGVINNFYKNSNLHWSRLLQYFGLQNEPTKSSWCHYSAYVWELCVHIRKSYVPSTQTKCSVMGLRLLYTLAIQNLLKHLHQTQRIN